MPSTLTQKMAECLGLLLLMLTILSLINTHGDCQPFDQNHQCLDGQYCDSETVHSQTPYVRVDTNVYTNPHSSTSGRTSSVASTYVRWGRLECPKNAELIYSGITVGASAFEKGGGGNFVCLPENPVYGTAEAGRNTDRANLKLTRTYGNKFGPFERGGQEISCAVCRAPRSTVLMIPGRNICPSEAWTLEYMGYLAAPRMTLQRAEFICVDNSPDGYPGVNSDVLSASEIHPVEVICEGLPCGPYVDGYELSCAVCTM